MIAKHRLTLRKFAEGKTLTQKIVQGFTLASAAANSTRKRYTFRFFGRCSEKSESRFTLASAAAKWRLNNFLNNR